MTSYQKSVFWEVARVLKKADGLPMDEAVLHARIEPHLFPAPTFADLRDVLATGESEGFFVGRTHGPLETRLWVISPRGAMETLV